MKKLIIIACLLLSLGIVVFSMQDRSNKAQIDSDARQQQVSRPDSDGGIIDITHPLQIEVMRQQEYPGSDLIVEQVLESGINYDRYIASYKSEGLKQYALLTVPNGEKPAAGWPAIVFNHGYIAPSEYRTTEKYVAYLDSFARNGYIVIKPDYRGHGNSEGRAEGGYGSPGYTIDVLNALGSLKRHQDVDTNNIGMWGHSMGGHITVRSMVIDPSIKAGVIWGGVVGSYQDYDTYWWSQRRRPTPTASPSPGQRGYWRRSLQETQGTYDSNPEFWNSISATSFLADISGPIQLHHAKGDETVPFELSENMQRRMEAAGKASELFLYEGDNHNISANFNTAMSRSIDFFDAHLK